MPRPAIDSDSLFQSFENQRVMVVGDVMLDRYVTGRALRISPEAPVPILEFGKEENRLGGAANVALNLQALGATPILCGLVGADGEGQAFLEKLEFEGIKGDGIITSNERMSTVKTRMIANNQQLLRLDKEQSHELTQKESLNFLSKTVGLMEVEDVSSIIFQDYNKGVLTAEVIRILSREAQRLNIKVCVDPKHRNFWCYNGVDLFKPNLKEINDALQTCVQPNRLSLKAAATAVRGRNNCKMTLITLSEHGVFVDDGEISEVHPTRTRKVADVCGAGDTVISVATLALGAGLVSSEIALLANLAGGQVVEKNGVVTVDKAQLKQELLQVLLEA
ncbi:MAG: carbohydrate kinase [Saprospiraceae bacterium]|nr:carbohydrate kinase [Saprospiraceae bacterium]MCF8248860.1 carbohydrate kinase [Saprospiraceae bacterium]MCF8279585.1 hypothetical protein [Bacteroidales bacterium]MCF8310145.1 carbohydrate kinase [Saprospiraceae bacterium]MCF8439045.1 carbohydrate kinase [Saprospiraceae bacterium]